MPITNENQRIGGGGNGSAEPYYINTHKVRRIEEAGNGPNDPDFLTDVDLALRLFYDIEGVDVTSWTREPDLLLFGDLVKNHEGRLTGQGSAFKIFEAFASLGVRLEIDHSLEIPRKALEEAQGCEFTKLRYVAQERDDGKGYFYNDFERVYPAHPDPTGSYSSQEAINDDLESLFLNQVSGGWVDDYRPELVGEDHTEPHEEARSQPVGAPPEKEDTFEPSDDLPF